MKTLLKNAHILTMDDRYTEYPSGWMMLENGRIIATGGDGAPETDAETVDCGGGILLPGFVNLHCHASMIPFRTLGDDCPDRLRRFLLGLSIIGRHLPKEYDQTVLPNETRLRPLLL